MGWVSVWGGVGMGCGGVGMGWVCIWGVGGYDMGCRWVWAVGAVVGVGGCGVLGMVWVGVGWGVRLPSRCRCQTP